MSRRTTKNSVKRKTGYSAARKSTLRGRNLSRLPRRATWRKGAYLNYARSVMPLLSTLYGPLTSRASPNVVASRGVANKSTRRREALLGLNKSRKRRERLTPLTPCSRRAQRRAVIIAGGYGGKNGFRKYRKRDPRRCK